MARKKRKPSKPSQAYLVSFGDTMTALLAFFIVLNSLAQEQTGANLYTGTGSFSAAVRGLGVPGWFKSNTSRTPIAASDSKPIYYVDDEGNAKGQGAGPDDEDNDLRVIDRQKEQVQRIVTELENLFAIDQNNRSFSEIEFDLFDSIGKSPDMLGASAKKVILKCIPLCKRPGYRVELIVWTPTPSPSAWERSAIKAQEIRKEVLRDFSRIGLKPDRLSTSSRVWISSTEKRPTMTVRVIKVASQ